MHKYLFNIKRKGARHWTNRIITADSLAEAWKKIVEYANDGFERFEFECIVE